MIEKGRYRGGRSVGEDNGSVILTKAKVLEVLAMREEGFTYREIGDHIGISRQQVGFIVRGEAWKHITRKEN
jgi:transcriptional regulator